MGYISKNIADINEPKQLTLAALPNFVQFASKPSTKTVLELNVEIRATPSTPNLNSRTVLNITASNGDVRSFHGTTVASEVGGNTFFVSTERSDTAENFRQALLADAWVRSNFEVVVPFNWTGPQPVNGNVVNIKAKGSGQEYLITVAAPNNVTNSAYIIDWVEPTSISGDSISGENSTAEIELDLYVDPQTFLGADDKPTTSEKIGHYLTTLSKTYAGEPLWFELNTIFNQYLGHNIPQLAAGWFPTGTLSAYRFVAKLRGVNSFPFYQSSALYVLNGYGRISEAPDLTEYTYSQGTVRLLTNKPRTPYVRGQREYINFIFSDPQRGTPYPVDFSLAVSYRAYTAAGDFLGVVYDHAADREDFAMVNTCVLDLDKLLDAYPTAELVKVQLVRDNTPISNALEYDVLPECLHTLQQFTFLNRLGGWDNFNMDAEPIDEIKMQGLTYEKTLTPSFKLGDSLETVYKVTLDNTLTVEGAPVYDDVAEWLKEMAASKVVINNEGFYIIIEELELRVDPKNHNMHVPKIKYRLSENYKND